VAIHYHDGVDVPLRRRTGHRLYLGRLGPPKRGSDQNSYRRKLQLRSPGSCYNGGSAHFGSREGNDPGRRFDMMGGSRKSTNRVDAQ
jgi:hypothetical protein